MVTIKVFQKFQNNIKWISLTKKRIQKTLTVNRDIEKSYEWLFLYSVTLFESYLEEIFLLLLKQRLKWTRSSGVLLNKDFTLKSTLSNKRIKEFILWEKPWEYLDWIPYSKTSDRAKKYLKDWNPFMLTSDDLKILNQIVQLRNYIAHKSKESKDKLESSLWFKILSVKHLLNKIHSGTYSYFDFYVNNIWKFAHDIQKNLVESK